MLSRLGRLSSGAVPAQTAAKFDDGGDAHRGKAVSRLPIQLTGMEQLEEQPGFDGGWIGIVMGAGVVGQDAERSAQSSRRRPAPAGNAERR